MRHIARGLLLCATAFATACGGTNGSEGPPMPAAAPMDLRLGVPLLSREVPLRLSQLTGPYATAQECWDHQLPFNACYHQITLCSKGKLTVVITDILAYGSYTLSGSLLQVTTEDISETPKFFEGIFAEDGSFTSTQLSGGLPFQNYVLSATERARLDADCEFRDRYP